MPDRPRNYPHSQLIADTQTNTLDGSAMRGRRDGRTDAIK